MKKILCGFLAIFTASAFFLGCGGGGGGGGSTSISPSSGTAGTDNSAALAGKSFTRAWSVPLSNTTTTVDCTGLIAYTSNGTYHEDSNLYVDGALTSSGSRNGTWTLLSDGTFTTTDTGGSVAETTLWTGTDHPLAVSCSDGNRYQGYTFKRLASFDSAGNLTVRTLVLDVPNSSWVFYKIDSTSTSLSDTYVTWDTQQCVGSTKQVLGADGSWVSLGTRGNATGNWTGTLSGISGILYLTNIVETSTSPCQAFHSSTASRHFTLDYESVGWVKR